MTVPKMLHILSMGNRKGSALKELADYYGCENYDLSPISDDMADAWLIRKKEGYKECSKLTQKEIEELLKRDRN